MQSRWFEFAAASAVVLFCGAAQAAVVHSDGFTDTRGVSSNGVQHRSVGSFDVEVMSDDARSTEVSFDFFGSKSVDGDNSYRDNYSFILNGKTLFEATFDLGGGGGTRVFTNEGFSFVRFSEGAWAGGTVSVTGVVGLLAGLNTFTFAFTSPGGGNGKGQPLGDEGWGVNNFEVAPAVVPLPAGLPLLAGALAGLGLLARRRRLRA